MTFWFLNKYFVKVITRSSEGWAGLEAAMVDTTFFFNSVYLETLKYTTPSYLSFRHASTKFVCCVEISVVFEISAVVCGLFFVYFSILNEDKVIYQVRTQNKRYFDT